jgi:exopolyphosphatase/guanosine-5'-triphosphate,3'-diphosphate pyrophosphatase
MTVAAPAAIPIGRPGRRYRLAAIDIGTNSIHMIIVEAQRHGYRVIDKEKEMVQLGRGSLEGNPLTDDALERGVTTLHSMAEIAQRWNVDEIVAVATSAIREAPNRRRFLRAAAKAGVDVRVISGEEEADYIYRAVRSAIDFHGGTALVIDIGGGSVELVLGTDSEVFFTASEPLGALRMAQKFGDDIPDCATFIRKRLKKTLSRARELGFDFAVGTSGTIMTLAELAAETTVDSGLRWLSRAKLEILINEIAATRPDDRAQRFDIDPRRAETLLSGAIVLDEIMDRLRIDQIRACDAALREGIVERVLDSRRTQKSRGGVRRSSVLSLAEHSNVDLAHSQHVARLALRIFDQTEELHQLRTGERELLEYAALLHEVGTHVSFQSHHKHSFYLISHAGLRGFTADQVAMMANVARYYRKSEPDREHPWFAQLSERQQEIVEKLVAILRIADALDRGRRGAIRDVSVDGDGKGVVFTLRKRADAAVEIAAAVKKAKYFRRIFDRRVEFVVR